MESLSLQFCKGVKFMKIFMFPFKHQIVLKSILILDQNYNNFSILYRNIITILTYRFYSE